MKNKEATFFDPMEGTEVTRDIKEYLQKDTDNIVLVYKSNKSGVDLEYFGTKRSIITQQYNDVHNVFYGCNRVITTLIPREEDYNKMMFILNSIK